MKISTRGRYGLRAIIDIARNYRKDPVLLKDVARRQDVSMKYLDHIISPLRDNDILKRVKDGYVLNRSPDKLDVLTVVKALEGSIAPVKCLEKKDFCNRTDKCVAREVWQSVDNSISEVLGSITIEELVERKIRRQRNG